MNLINRLLVWLGVRVYYKLTRQGVVLYEGCNSKLYRRAMEPLLSASPDSGGHWVGTINDKPHIDVMVSGKWSDHSDPHNSDPLKWSVTDHG